MVLDESYGGSSLIVGEYSIVGPLLFNQRSYYYHSAGKYVLFYSLAKNAWQIATSLSDLSEVLG